MSKTKFNTNPHALDDLLRKCGEGKIQLPDFQRSWVWGEDRITSLIASISRSFPVGALMTIESRHGSTDIFARRPIQGASFDTTKVMPEELLLDGQQRMTSLYHACYQRGVVETLTPKNKVVRRWFYIDIQKALKSVEDREESIVAVPEDRRIKANFDRDVVLDLTTQENEYEALMFPLNRVFDWDEWQEGFGDYWIGKGDLSKRDVFKAFKNEVLNSFKFYQVPVITLAHDTSHEAVCLVFEKVNTGGKPLDAFELLTAMYAAKGHKLRDDWLGVDGKSGILGLFSSYATVSGQKTGVLAKVASTDFLQAIALLHTKNVREEAKAAGVKDNDLPGVRASRQSLLDLPLEAYLKYRDCVKEGFLQAAKFLRQQMVFRVYDLPYQTQLVPMAAIFADLGQDAEHASHQDKIARWYWCGVFGELYGSAVESRFAKDIVEVPLWLSGGEEASSVRDGIFRTERLNYMRSRQSAAYKGIHCLLMHKGAKDFRTGQAFDVTVFFDEQVDIHHIFPEKWCKDRKVSDKIYDTVVNKTPLSYRTNRIIGGVAPSEYLKKLEAGKVGPGGQVEVPPITPDMLNKYLVSHCIPVDAIRSDDFESFMNARRSYLLDLIQSATGHTIAEAPEVDDGEEPDDEHARDMDLPQQSE